MSAEPTVGNKELADALAPSMGLPVVTPQMYAAGLQALLGQVVKECKAMIREAATDTTQAKGGAAWMTITELAKHFGYHRTTMHKMIAPYVEAGTVRAIQPPDDGCRREPNRKYSLADVLAVLTPQNPTRSKASHENAEA